MKVNLSVRSDFSLGRSMVQVDKLVERAAALEIEALAITDLNSIQALPDFSAKCKKAGIKPIVGVTLYVHDDPLYKKPARTKAAKNSPFIQLRVFVLNQSGFAWLLKALSIAHTEDRFYYHARNGWEDFEGAEGIAVATGDFYGIFSHAQREDRLQKLIGMVGAENVYAELAPVPTPLFNTMNRRAVAAIKKHGLPGLVGYPTLYLDDADADSLDVLGAIAEKEKMDSMWLPRHYSRKFSLKSSSEMQAAIAAAQGADGDVWTAAVADTEALAARVSFSIEKMPISLPTLAADPDAELMAQCRAGWLKRLTVPTLGYMPTQKELKEKYLPRLGFEAKTLFRMGFSSYFLLAQQIVNWSKTNGILVGPGRGSVGGSLVAYLLGITDVDPIRFNLLFERFINPDRLDLPDADLDFMSSRRHEVIEFLERTYGADRVAGISNYAAMAAAGAMRDTGRVFGLEPYDMSASKLVPAEHGQPVPLVAAAAEVPDIERFSLDHPKVWKHAVALEGCMRSFSKHAAGVVVSGVPLVERAVVTTDRDGGRVVCWDKRVVEDFGLVKLDILGLSTLDVLSTAAKFIKARHGKEINFLDIPLGEPDIMAEFAKGSTTGVFQFESPGMRKLLKDLATSAPLTFDDITAATALYRPGPMDSGLLDDFVAIKKGIQAPKYDHPLMEPALQDTYSVIVYQEQVMQVAVDLAGFTRTEADHLRKIMGKKLKTEMVELRQKWIDGCFATAGMPAQQAGVLFDKIEAFAGYGFNKSHAVEYSVISYFTMWLRVRYPAEYFAACMSIVDSDKRPGLVKDAREFGIEVWPPDINVSTDEFVIVADDKIVAPFNVISGSSQSTAQKIVALRNEAGGAFASAEDFKNAAKRPKSGVNVRVVQRLDDVGALALIDPTQARLPPRHPDRRKAQTELMQGVIIDVVKADRATDLTDGHSKPKLAVIVRDYSQCAGCSLKDSPHPAIRMPKSVVKFMVVLDCPSWEEEKAGRLFEGTNAIALRTAITNAGLNVGEGYYTTLVKARKNEKFLTNEQINGCRVFIERELEIVKPAVIIALGSAAIKHFVPGSKGGAAEMSGKAVYDSKREASIVAGINPAQIHFDPSKQDTLNETFQKVAEIIN